MFRHNGKTTDGLIKEEHEITEKPEGREHDVLVSTGEQITISKICMCLQSLGYKAKSLTGWQVPIITTKVHTNARIKYIDNTRILKELDNGYIVVIAGFQGISIDSDITTLGRGGSDTTAVAIAASLKADKCDIYTDVDGVYSADPRIIPDVKKIENISYEEMLELASLGAKVLHNRCVELGKKYEIPIYVKSTFENESRGTKVVNKNGMEDLTISGVAKESDVARITIISTDTKIGRTYEVFKLLAENNINVDIIVQAFGEHIEKNISFTVKKQDLDKTTELLNNNLEELNAKEVKYCDNLAKISIVGVGITNNPGVAARLFEVLYKNNINMQMISTSEIKISILVNKQEADLALKKIHEEFINK